MSKVVFLVDDDRTFLDRLALAFEDRGYQVHSSSNYAQAMATAHGIKPDMAVLDLKMPGHSGLELLRDLKALHPQVEVVMLTGYGSVATAVDAVRLGALNYVAKPASTDMILAAFERGRNTPLTPPEADYEPPSLARAEWEHINRVLADCDGNISKAARLLGLHRRTLQRKLSKYPPNE